MCIFLIVTLLLILLFFNFTEAVEAIIRYSLDYSTILNRKCVKRDILFQYCHDNNIFIIPPVTKLLLIQKILDHWSCTSSNQQLVYDVSEQQHQEEAATISQQNIITMANKFAEWFYGLMNLEEPIGEEHLWADCSLQLKLSGDGAQVEKSVEADRAQVVQALFETRRDHRLFFNPNLTSDGVHGRMDAHGLVLIFTCGTLHTSDKCVGVFEQMFSLARDPFCQNNWKIKNTSLSLKSKEVTAIPRLCDSSTCHLLLALGEN